MRCRELVKNGRRITVYEDGRIYSHAFVSCIGRKRKGRFLKQFKTSNGYMQIKLGGEKCLTHRLICEALHPNYSEDLQVDHINGHKTDNRISNLRMVTRSGNQRAHRAINPNASSRYRGVSWNRSWEKWVAQIRINDKIIYLGGFHNELDAARAYNAAAIERGFLPEALNKIPNHNQPLTQAEFAFA